MGVFVPIRISEFTHQLSRRGAGVVEQVSLDLKREFPDAEGFSTRNLWYMKQWYIFYTSIDFQLLQRVGAELQRLTNQHETKLHHVGAEIKESSIRSLAWIWAFVTRDHASASLEKIQQKIS